MNKSTTALTEEQYEKIISTILTGFICEDGHIVKPNKRIATALSLEANLGLRISDILQLRLSSIVHDGDRYRLDIVEKKTQKKRNFTVPTEIYIYIQNYALENGINPQSKLFDLSERAVSMHLKLVCDYLGYACPLFLQGYCILLSPFVSLTIFPFGECAIISFFCYTRYHFGTEFLHGNFLYKIGI